MRVAIEVLCGKFKKLGILERFHLMDQTRRYVHALAGLDLEFFYYFVVKRALDSDARSAAAKQERFSLQLMIM
jgi:hypothetical protein